MTILRRKRILAGLLVAGLVTGIPVLGLLPFTGETGLDSPNRVKTASARALGDQYQRWLENYQQGGTSPELRMALGWSRALSRTSSPAHGVLSVNLEDGGVSAYIDGMGEDVAAMDLWLVDNVEGEGHSVKPEASDRSIRVGRFHRDGERYVVDGKVPGFARGEFDLDIAVVTPAQQPPWEEGLLFASGTLFQRIYMQSWDGRQRPAELIDQLAAALGVKSATAESPLDSMDQLISAGADIFFNGTFNGNGRSCGTCHPANNNFTIDPAFIATLPDNDPLFVAEYIPALGHNFEVPALMRRMGLIRENLDGFDDLDNKFVMRGVLHTTALSTSIAPAPGGMDGTTTPPDQRVGWGGDGAPGSGTLRDFATGAVVQHYPLRPERVEGVDFRLPTDFELDALEAFQLALGRQQDLDLGTMSFSDPVAENGKQVFMRTDTAGASVAAGKCVMCHLNAGASSIFAPGSNFNFDTGVERIAVKAASLVAPGMAPADAGFGVDPSISIPGGFGDGTFSAPPLVEAADTPPFFHNSAATTLEEAVAFYDSDAFSSSPRGQFLASLDSGGVGVSLDPTSELSIAAFLRTINALDNINTSKDTGLSAKVAATRGKTMMLLDVMQSDVQDALEVLAQQNLNIDAAAHITTANILIHDAMTASDAPPTELVCRFFFCRRIAGDGPSAQEDLIDQAIAELEVATGMMLN